MSQLEDIEILIRSIEQLEFERDNLELRLTGINDNQAHYVALQNSIAQKRRVVWYRLNSFEDFLNSQHVQLKKLQTAITQ